MHDVFQGELRKIVLVFFDDILIYSPTWEEHMNHLRRMLTLMKENQLLAKKSKCAFGQEKVEYLGYIISTEGVATDS